MPATNPPNIIPYIVIIILGVFVACQSWMAGERLNDSFISKLGILFALGSVFIAINGLRRSRRVRKSELPAAPAEYKGDFAPDFRRNLRTLYQSLGKGTHEMTLEHDYAFWYNDEQAIEITLTPEGWLAFFQIAESGYNAEAPLVQRAVADSPFATHPVALELAKKYADLPLSGIAWCTSEKMKVYPCTATEDFTRCYAGNLFAPAEVFDAWLSIYLNTGIMNEGA